MPFTISHAAAVLPLHRLSKSRLPLAALMVGSMAPDFAYFLPYAPERLATHNLPGIFSFCLPVGLLVWLMYVRVLEAPTVALLPQTWRARTSRSNPELSARNLALVAIAIVIGAATHIAWDSFTHGNTAMNEAFPVLRTVVFEIEGDAFRLYRCLQHLSTLLGGAVLAGCVLRQLRRPAARAPADALAQLEPPLPVGTRIAALALLLGSAGSFGIGGYLAHDGAGIEERLYHLAIGGMSGWLAAWIAVAGAIRLRSYATRRYRASPIR